MRRALCLLGGLALCVLTLPASGLAQAPSTPSPPSLWPKSRTVLTVKWTAPSGAPTSYDLQYHRGVETSWTAGPQDQTGTSVDITGLEADTLYLVQVRATNTSGDSGWSDVTGRATAFFEADLTVAQHRYVSDRGDETVFDNRRGYTREGTNTGYRPGVYGALSPTNFIYDGKTYEIYLAFQDTIGSAIGGPFGFNFGYSSGTPPLRSGGPLGTDHLGYDWAIFIFLENNNIRQYNATGPRPTLENGVWSFTPDTSWFKFNRNPIKLPRFETEWIDPITSASTNTSPSTRWTVGQTYPFTIARRKSSTGNDPPEVTGADTPEYVEGETGPVAIYTASNPANVRLTWTVTGTDADAFTIANGVLRFKTPPDYEDPPNKQYAVTVTASDGTDTGEWPVTVTVLDALGQVRLPTARPQVGRALTATVVNDPDGVAPHPATPDEWCWERSRFPTFPPGATTEIACTATTSGTYTPVHADLGQYLRVTVTYTDGQATRKAMSVQDETAEPVASAPARPQPPPVFGGGGGSSAPESEPSPEPVGYLENPGVASPQSGIHVISGWVCEAEEVEIEIGHLGRLFAAYGTERLDTAAECGDTDNGFGLLFNWNRLGDGEHEVVAFVDGVELGRATVTVTTLGEEFLREVTGACVAPDFPLVGETVTLEWQQTQQNFVIARGPAPQGADRAGAIDVGYLENPGPNSFQSGIGVISGWVCEGDEVIIELNGEGQPAAYGTERLDTEAECGDTDNGFGLLFNWNRLGEGEHEVVAFVDGEELGRATVRVTTLGEEFVRGVGGECTVPDFPMEGESVTLEWQQNSQNFVIVDVE